MSTGLSAALTELMVLLPGEAEVQGGFQGSAVIYRRHRKGDTARPGIPQLPLGPQGWCQAAPAAPHSLAMRRAQNSLPGQMGQLCLSPGHRDGLRVGEINTKSG